MKKTQGTPKSLDEAIRNGLSEVLESHYTLDPHISTDQWTKLSSEEIEKHVIDFLAQKFSIAMNFPDPDQFTFKNLWSLIITSNKKSIDEK